MVSATSQSTTNGARNVVLAVSGSLRALFALVGMGGLVGGAIAVFMTTNQAGTVALLAVGAIASLLAVVGKVPLRWVIGGHEFDMSERLVAEEVVDAVTAQLDPASTRALSERLAHTSASSSLVARGMADYVAFEQAAIGRVMQAIAPQGWTYTNAAADRGQYDGFVVIPSGERFPVEFKLVRSRDARQSLIRYLFTRRARGDTQDLVLVVGSAPHVPLASRTVEPEIPMAPGVELVDANAPDFERQFIAACDAILSRMGSEPEPRT